MKAWLGSHHPARDGLTVTSVPNRSTDPSVPLPIPGVRLAALIDEAVEAGRPGCVVGTLPDDDSARLSVPRTLVRARGPGEGEFFPGEPAAIVLPSDWAALAFETQNPIAFAQLGGNDWAALNRLYATALYDIVGLSYHEIEKACGSNAIRMIRRGREAWRRLGAWPWAHFPSGGFPRSWRRDGPDPKLAYFFEVWRTGNLIPRRG